jgi:hypothetical protein
VLDEGTEWRSFADDTSNRVNPDRVGAAQSVLFSGDELGTRITGIGTGNTGPLGKEFSSDALERANQRNGMSSADRGLQQAYQEIQFIASKLNIPGNITFGAQLLYAVPPPLRLSAAVHDALPFVFTLLIHLRTCSCCAAQHHFLRVIFLSFACALSSHR